MCAGLLAAPVASFAQRADRSPYAHDPRLSRLKDFFRVAGCPIRRLADEFLLAADHNGLDWRLLPTIAVVETGCGRAATGNNVFGWDSGKKKYTSVREGIHAVASRLSQSKLYRGKDLDHILATYNPRPRYAALVKSVMRHLGPADAPAEALTAVTQLSLPLP
jgi:Mannosyl-glycoprotein endo-beta-N-acetylglucosaminidase